MKKNLFIGLAFAALAAGGCFLAGNTTPRHQFTPDQIANIKALTDEESLTSPCNNTSGYRAWNTSSPGPYSKQHFRDCCYKEKNSYNPISCTHDL